MKGKRKFAVDEPMSPQLAVFNCHINNAKNKSSALYRKRWGKESFNKQIKPKIKAGIMSIFHETPTQQVKWFVLMITKIVNDGRPWEDNRKNPAALEESAR